MTTIYAVTDKSPIILEELPGTTLVVSIPAAFSSTCTNECVPGILKHQKDILAGGVDRIIVVCTDGPHAVKAWVKAQNWEDSGFIFASDFGEFQYRERIGKLSDEEGKTALPQVSGNQLRRSYTVYRDGSIVWQLIEPDAGKYTFDVEEMLAVV